MRCIAPQRYKFLVEFAICTLYAICPRARYVASRQRDFYHIASELREDISHLRSKYIARAKRVYHKKL